MMPIATISLVTADQLSCRLTAADDLAWPECASGNRKPGGALNPRTDPYVPNSGIRLLP
jgi:hypothetical protein